MVCGREEIAYNDIVLSVRVSNHIGFLKLMGYRNIGTVRLSLNFGSVLDSVFRFGSGSVFGFYAHA